MNETNYDTIAAFWMIVFAVGIFAAVILRAMWQDVKAERERRAKEEKHTVETFFHFETKTYDFEGPLPVRTYTEN